MSGGRQDKEFAEIIQQNASFEIHERQFQQVLLELEGDDVILPFRQEYETVHHSFLKAHDNERRLIKKCQDLQAEIVTCHHKIRTAEELSHGDRQTIENLKREIQKVRARLEDSREKQSTMRSDIDRLYQEVHDLEAQVHAGVGGLTGYDETLENTQKELSVVTVERSRQQQVLTSLRNHVASQQEITAKLEKELNVHHASIKAMEDIMISRKNAVAASMQEKKKWDGVVAGLREELTDAQKSIEDRSQMLVKVQEEIANLKNVKTRCAAALAAKSQQYEELRNIENTLETKLNAQFHKGLALDQQIKTLTSTVKTKDGEFKQVEESSKKHQRLAEALHSRNAALATAVEAKQEEVNEMALEAAELTKECAAMRELVSSTNAAASVLSSEQRLLGKGLVNVQNSASEHNDAVFVQLSCEKNIKTQIRGQSVHLESLREKLFQVESSVHALQSETTTTSLKYMKVVHDVGVKQRTLEEAEAVYNELEAKLKTQKHLCDVVVQERNAYAKQLLQLHGQVAELRRNFRLQSHHIQQLLDERTSKERSILFTHFQYRLSEVERNRLADQGEKYKKQIAAADAKIAHLSAELSGIDQVMQQAAAETKKQQRDYEAIVSERDLIGQQLLRRNDDLAKMYQLISTQEMELAQSATSKLKGIRESNKIKASIRILEKELEELDEYASRAPELKNKVVRLEKEIRELQLKDTSLTTETSTAMNIHWMRTLESTDPQKFSVIQRIWKLRNQNLRKVTELRQREKEVELKEREFMALQKELRRLPGLEMTEQIQIYAENYETKKSQLKAMKASLHLFESRSQACAADLKRVSEDIESIKKSYFKRLKAARHAAASQFITAGPVVASPVSPSMHHLLLEQEAVQSQLRNEQNEARALEAARQSRKEGSSEPAHAAEESSPQSEGVAPVEDHAEPRADGTV